MRSSVLLSLATLGLSAATIAAPSAQAQSNSRLIVCRDGSRFESTNASVCARHRGVDGRATAEARRNDRWDDRRDARDDRRDRRDDRDDRWDDRRSNDPRHDPNRRDDRGYGYGTGGRREVYEWTGVVDKEVQIQLRGGRAYVRGIGEGDDRASRGRVISGLPQQPGNLFIQRLDGRGEVSVIEQPSARNNYTATFRIRDPRGGADRYRIAVFFEPVGGRYGYGR